MFNFNSILSLVLFESGATRSFVSFSLNKNFGDASGFVAYVLDTREEGQKTVNDVSVI